MFENLINLLRLPNRIDALEVQMSELSDAYASMVNAVNEVVGELRTLSGRVAELEGESAPIAADLRTLAARLSDAYVTPEPPTA